MAESMRRWVSEHKLRTVGCLWLSGITGSIAYNWSRPTMKTSVKLIHARLHAQALTLAALVGAAAIDYLDHDNAPTKNDPVGGHHYCPWKPEAGSTACRKISFTFFESSIVKVLYPENGFNFCVAN